MLKLSVVNNLLEITNGETVINSIPIEIVGLYSLNLYRDIPMVTLYNNTVGRTDVFLEEKLSNIVNSGGIGFTVATFNSFYAKELNKNEVINLATNDIGRDAWGRPKTINDHSILHGMFTFNVPVNMWKETFNDTIQVITNATSVNGKLHLVSGATLNDVTVLDTYRNPRYEPNRGILYSTSVFLPNKTALGTRQFGYFTEESGAYFSLESGVLYAIVKTTIDSVTDEDKYVIDTTDINLEKGNTFDIQMQWRGVGNYKFYINLQEVKVIDYLGTRTELTMFNPANPIAFRCENLGDNVVIECGCVDVTSEGGSVNGKLYGSIGVINDAGEVAITGYNIPIIAVRSKLSVNGKRNTRDTLALLATGYSDQRSMLRIWSTRDFTAISENDQVWSDYGDGHLEYIVFDPTGNEMTFNTTKAELIFSGRVNVDSSYATSALFEGRTEIYQTPGEMFVFTMHRENGLAEKSGVTYEFAEEI